MATKSFTQYMRMSELPLVQAITNGLVMIIPITMIGSFALILRSLPVAVYQSFLATFMGGTLLQLLTMVHNATLGMLALYMTAGIAYCYAQGQGGSGNYGCVSATVVSLAGFVILVGVHQEGFLPSAFGASGMFSAIVASLSCSYLFFFFDKVIHYRPRFYYDGIGEAFNNALKSLLPSCLTIATVAILNYGLMTMFRVAGFQELFGQGINLLFANLGNTLGAGILFVFSSSLMWFFGVHGSNVLEIVSLGQYVPAMERNVAAVAAGGLPTEILTKTFFDCFVLIGGCGCTLSLLIAIAVFSKRRDNRALAKCAFVPMLFNINEIMVFGLPTVLNPIMFIPFLLTPLVMFFSSYFAMSMGLVPLTMAAAEWTTPIIFSGYAATGSAAGAVLQVFNVFLGVLVYRPFVLLLDKAKNENASRVLQKLTQQLRDAEKNQEPVTLTTLNGEVGALAKTLVHDVRHAILTDELNLHYQPQFDHHNRVIGAEALLRWDHPVFGMMYPPLVIKLAHESGTLTQLEELVFRYAAQSLASVRQSVGRDMPLCVNLSPASMREPALLPYLADLVDRYKIPQNLLCIEITEQMVVMLDQDTETLFAQMKALGFRFAIDDFAMGFTSIKYLQGGQFDLLKIDGELIQNLVENGRCQEIVGSVIHMADSLNFDVLAECVETTEQQKKLEALGCTQYQGYLFSPAVPLEQYIAILRHENETADIP